MRRTGAIVEVAAGVVLWSSVASLWGGACGELRFVETGGVASSAGGHGGTSASSGGSGGDTGSSSTGGGGSASSGGSGGGGGASSTSGSNSSVSSSSSGGGGMTLLNGLSAYYKMDELSGARADALGLNPLQDMTNVASGVGLLGKAAKFTGVDGMKLVAADAPELRMGTSDFTIAAWVYFAPDVPGGQNNENYVIDKWEGGKLDYELYYHPDSVTQGHWVFATYADLHIIMAITGTLAYPQGQWHLVIGWQDTASGEIRVEANGMTYPGTSFTSAGAEPGAAFVVGAHPGNCNNQCLPGMIDEIGVWHRVLTGAERALLWNGGLGVTYPF